MNNDNDGRLESPPHAPVKQSASYAMIILTSLSTPYLESHLARQAADQ